MILKYIPLCLAKSWSWTPWMRHVYPCGDDVSVSWLAGIEVRKVSYTIAVIIPAPSA